MGITDFHKWIRETYPESYDKTNKNKYDHIYIDLNHYLHNAIYKSTSQDNFFEKLYTILDRTISKYHAKNSFVIATDGPATYAKILLQRKRRDISEFNDKFDSLSLTLGTTFMYRVDEEMNKYLELRKDWFKFRKTKLVYIPMTKPDEAELKIIRNILKNEGTHLFISNDADVIVMSMACLVKNIYVMTKDYRIISIDNLTKSIVKHTSLNENVVRLDFTLLSIMMGNDYLPKVDYVTFKNLWNSYIYISKYIKGIIIDNVLKIDNFKVYLDALYDSLNSKYKKISLKSNDDNVKNYFEGLLWCVDMYKSGTCRMYDYSYNGDRIEVFDIRMYLSGVKKVDVVASDTEPIPIEIYPLLVLPKKAKSIMPESCKKLMDSEFRYLYEEEDCSKCNKFKKEVNNLYKMRRNGHKDLNHRIHHTSQNYSKHRETHNVKFDIKEIIDMYTESQE